MELSDLRPIVDFYYSKLAQVTLDFKRYLYPQINWDAGVIGIKGERGVGTLVRSSEQGYWARFHLHQRCDLEQLT